MSKVLKAKVKEAGYSIDDLQAIADCVHKAADANIPNRIAPEGCYTRKEIAAKAGIGYRDSWLKVKKAVEAGELEIVRALYKPAGERHARMMNLYRKVKK
jgi:hypothetical protein